MTTEAHAVPNRAIAYLAWPGGDIMPPISVANSFMGDRDKTSYYDVVFPLYHLSTGRPPQLIGSCFSIGIGIYMTAAHNFDAFKQVRERYGRPPGERKRL